MARKRINMIVEHSRWMPKLVVRSALFEQSIYTAVTTAKYLMRATLPRGLV